MIFENFSDLIGLNIVREIVSIDYSFRNFKNSIILKISETPATCKL
jgi:hypothetical protein